MGGLVWFTGSLGGLALMVLGLASVYMVSKCIAFLK